MNLETEWRYDRLTWPQMRSAIARQPQPVVAIPFGAVEDHGGHLPLSTDNDILESVLAEAGRLLTAAHRLPAPEAEAVLGWWSQRAGCDPFI